MQQSPCTVVIPSTRYFTTLPFTVQSILNQSVMPVRILIICDKEQNVDFKTNLMFHYLFALATLKGVTVDIAFSGGGKGVVHCYNEALKMIQTPIVWRMDDDEIAEYNCLEQMIKCMAMDTSIGAVGPSVYVPGQMICPKPDYITGTLAQVKNFPSVQWFTDVKYNAVEQLHSTFLFRMDVATPYPYPMSLMSFREETVFSYQIFKKNMKLMVAPQAVVWHFRQPGGARDGTAEQNQKEDEAKFTEWSKQFNVTFQDKPDCIAFNHALGDNLVLKNNLDKIQPYYKQPLYIASNYPNIYSGISGIVPIPMHEGQYLTTAPLSIYGWMQQEKWSGTMAEAIIKMLTDKKERK